MPFSYRAALLRRTCRQQTDHYGGRNNSPGERMSESQIIIVTKPPKGPKKGPRHHPMRSSPERKRALRDRYDTLTAA